MKSIYESIKNIMEMGSRGAQTSSDDGDAEARSKMSGTAQSWRSYSQGKQNTLPKTVSKDKWNSKHDVTQTAPVAVRDNGVKAGNEKTPSSNIKPVKEPQNAAKTEKPAPIPAASKKPQASTKADKPVADNAPTSNDVSKPAATDATSLAKAQGKETEDSGSAPTDTSSYTGKASSSKRDSILPADTMQKNLDQARKNLDNMMGNDDDEDKTPVGLKSATTPQGKQEEPEPKQAAKTEKPESDKDYSTGRPADKELDDKYGKGNTRTDTEGRTYTRQKGVMGQPDTETRSYASIGDFVNKIRGKGDVNGKETTKEAYVTKTFGVSPNLVSDIMEVIKKNKQSSEPRNDKEQDLAAHYGDPKRITHGDILVARGVVKPKKVEEGTMRNGKYVDDAPRPGTNEVPSPDEGYRGQGKPLYTPVDNKKSTKKTKTNESVSRTIARNALAKIAEAKDSWVDDDEDEDSKPAAQKSTTSTAQPKQPKAPKRASILPADTMQKNAARAKKNLDNMMTDTNEASDYSLDPKLKSPNSDEWNKPSNEKFKSEYHQGGNAAYDKDLRGQKKYKERTSGGLMNKIKDKLGIDKADDSYGPKQESRDTPGNSYEHQCAIHVRSESFGDGRTVTTQHADPDHDGYIAWYDVMFEHGIEKYVPTAELEILVSESHMHSKRKKVVKEEGEQPVLKTADDWEKEKQKKQAANSYAGNRGAQEPAQAAAPAAAAPSAGNETAKTGIAAGSPAISGAAPADNMKNAGDVLRAAQQGKNSNTVEAPKPAEKAAPEVNNQSSGYTAQSQAQKSPDAVNNQSSGYTAQSQAQKSPDAAEKPAAAAPAQATAAPKPGATTTAADGRTYTTQKGVMGQPDTQQRSYASIGDFLNKIRGKGDVNGKVAPAQASATEKPADNNQSSGYTAQSQAQKSPDAVNNQSSGYTAQSQAQKSPDAAEKPAGAPTAPPGQAAMSYAGKGADSGSTAQASSTPAPSGESPQEKAKKAAAKQPQRSFQGQGMVGTDF